MSMSTGTINDVLQDLDSFLESAQTKQAATADQNMGDKDTSHPSAQVDDQLLGDAPEKERSAENEADVSRDVGPQNINDANESDAEKPNSMESLTTAAPTGEDPSNETGSTKETKEDGTSSHPSDLESSVQKEKYAAFRADLDKKIKTDGLQKVACDLANEVLADIATVMESQTAEVKQASAAGAAAADRVLTESEKRAAEKNQIMDSLIKEAYQAGQQDAELLLDFYCGVAEGAAEKRAEEEAAANEKEDGGSKEEAGDSGNASSGAEDAVTGEGSEEAGALPPEDIQQLADMAAPAVEEPAPEMPAEAAMPAAEAMGAEALGGEMGAPGEEEVLDALSQALTDAGVTPEELVMAIEAEQGAAGPEMPIEQKVAAVQVAKTAAAKINHFRNLQALGRGKLTKKANLSVVWKMRQLVKNCTGK
jgi:hypothetical protein